MKKVIVSKFSCPGASDDCPNIGYEIHESDVPGLNAGEFLVDVGFLEAAKDVRIVYRRRKK